MSKAVCDARHCTWSGDDSEMLSAPNPFESEDTIYACPVCKTLEHSVITACDEPGCWNMACAGTPTGNDGYRVTCHTHIPKAQVLP